MTVSRLIENLHLLNCPDAHVYCVPGFNDHIPLLGVVGGAVGGVHLECEPLDISDLPPSVQKRIDDLVEENDDLRRKYKYCCAALETTNHKIKMKDIPIKNAMLAWSVPMDRIPEALVVEHPDLLGKSNHLDCTTGACYPGWERQTVGRQLESLVTDAWRIAIQESIPIEILHTALSVIPEYREYVGEN